jgi:hypothetical protein
MCLYDETGPIPPLKQTEKCTLRSYQSHVPNLYTVPGQIRAPMNFSVLNGYVMPRKEIKGLLAKSRNAFIYTETRKCLFRILHIPKRNIKSADIESPLTSFFVARCQIKNESDQDGTTMLHPYQQIKHHSVLLFATDEDLNYKERKKECVLKTARQK